MDKKQLNIFHSICSKYNLPHKNKFIQHRNLKEFKYFEIERINPNHRIFLFGRLKKKYNKHRGNLHFIKVGEIILYSAFIIIPTNNYILDIEIKFISLISIFSVLFDLSFDNRIIKYLGGIKYSKKIPEIKVA